MAKYDIGTPRHAKACKCGGPVTLWTDTGTPDFFVECDRCGVDGPIDTAYSAIARWNSGERDDDGEQP